MKFGVGQAEGEGFEPPVKTSPTMVFKTIALIHSAIPPMMGTLPRARILPRGPVTVNEIARAQTYMLYCGNPRNVKRTA